MESFHFATGASVLTAMIVHNDIISDPKPNEY